MATCFYKVLYLIFFNVQNISESYVILVDPMLASGGSALRAIDVLKVQVEKEF